ncbi:MAG TPA: lytic transglycosylase domain-containing protein [Candidatus Binatia bacterium]|nr:lytic transglycosylase domain-containing protein [Candidatus Binatia bacterium]
MRALVGILYALLVSQAVLAADRAAPSQASSPSDPFAVYEATLNDAASRTLDRVVQPQPATIAKQTLQESGTGEKLTALPSHDTRNSLQRVARLRPMLDPILSQTGVPVELSAIVVVESGGDPDALSPKGARGLWQLMPDTARRYGLRVDAEADERLDAVKSTRAAAEYLRDLFAEFHDWQLALAAYNAGEQSVQQAMARTGGAVFSIVARALPAETQNYVPAVFNVLPRFGDSNPKQLTSRARLQRAVYASVGQ